MGKYSIKEIEQLTGIKAHTFRIWEQRYNILIPHRTDTNIRFYDDDQLKFALNLSYLNRSGLKISKLAKLTKKEIDHEVISISENNLPDDLYLNRLILGMIEMDESKFHHTLKEAIKANGVEKTFEDLIFPFLRKTGFMWANGSVSPSQEHFASNIIRKEIIIEISKIKVSPVKKDRFLLFLPDGELHELSLLLSEYMIKSRGFETVYLGASVPFIDLKNVKKIANTRYMFSVITSLKNNLNVQEYLNDVSNIDSKSTLIVAGNSDFFEEVIFPKNVKFMKSLHETAEFLDQI